MTPFINYSFQCSLSCYSISIFVDRKDFTTTFPGNYNPIYSQITAYFTDNCLRGDQGVLSIMSQLFSKDRNLLEKYVRPDSILVMGKAKLNLPRDIETWNEVEKVLTEKYQKKKFYPIKVKYNHPVDWNKVAALPDSAIAKLTGEAICALYRFRIKGNSFGISDKALIYAAFS